MAEKRLSFRISVWACVNFEVKVVRKREMLEKEIIKKKITNQKKIRVDLKNFSLSICILQYPILIVLYKFVIVYGTYKLFHIKNLKIQYHLT